MLISVAEIDIGNLATKGQYRFKDPMLQQPEGTIFAVNPAHEQV